MFAEIGDLYGLANHPDFALGNTVTEDISSGYIARTEAECLWGEIAVPDVRSGC